MTYWGKKFGQRIAVNGRRFGILMGVAVVVAMVWPGPVSGKMNARTIAEAIERKVQAGADGQTLWNMGYMYYHQYGPTVETAGILSEAYRQVTSEDKVQEKALRSAARHWLDNYKYWGRNKPGDLNDQPEDDYIWRFVGKWESNLKIYPPGDRRYRPKSSFYRRRNNAGWDTTMKMHAPRKYP